jgi:hypothetical protein
LKENNEMGSTKLSTKKTKKIIANTKIRPPSKRPISTLKRVKYG